MILVPGQVVGAGEAASLSDTELGAVIAALTLLVAGIIWMAKRQTTASEKRDAVAAAAAERRELAQEGVMIRLAVAFENVGDGQKSLAAAVERLNDRLDDDLADIRGEVRGLRDDLFEKTPRARPTPIPPTSTTYGPTSARKKEG